MDIDFKYLLHPIENDLLEVMKIANGEFYGGYHHMLLYHLGWSEGIDTKIVSGGKRIRPILVLLTTSSAGGDWNLALPAATAVELVHNFSLIHDDIEDDSPSRRGKPTVWKKWGIPQAINAGDALFSLATLAILRLKDKVPHEVTIEASYILNYTCLELTQGQYLDISFENRKDITVDEYLVMIRGKTSALISASCELGALIADADPEIRKAYKFFGVFLGLAYQIRDDILGIWGNQEKTGKSNLSDILSRKKTLPIIYGLQHIPAFRQLWMEDEIIMAEKAGVLAELLEHHGGREFAEKQASLYTEKAIQCLDDAHPSGVDGDYLFQLTDNLLKRKH